MSTNKNYSPQWELYTYLVRVFVGCSNCRTSSPVVLCCLQRSQILTLIAAPGIDEDLLDLYSTPVKMPIKVVALVILLNTYVFWKTYVAKEGVGCKIFYIGSVLK